MAFNKAPSNWITGYSSDGTNITIPIASLVGLNATLANATTGDIRSVGFSVLETFRIKWAATAAADRPAKFVMNSGASMNSDTGVITKTYTHTVQLNATGLSVAAEA